jgi:hypothetical protein
VCCAELMASSRVRLITRWAKAHSALMNLFSLSWSVDNLLQVGSRVLFTVDWHESLSLGLSSMQAFHGRGSFIVLLT